LAEWIGETLVKVKVKGKLDSRVFVKPEWFIVHVLTVYVVQGKLCHQF